MAVACGNRPAVPQHDARVLLVQRRNAARAARSAHHAQLLELCTRPKRRVTTFARTVTAPNGLSTAEIRNQGTKKRHQGLCW